MLGPGVSNVESNLQAADGENRGISNCFFGKVGRNFNEIFSTTFFSWKQKDSIDRVDRNER